MAVEGCLGVLTQESELYHSDHMFAEAVHETGFYYTGKELEMKSVSVSSARVCKPRAGLKGCINVSFFISQFNFCFELMTTFFIEQCSVQHDINCPQSDKRSG